MKGSSVVNQAGKATAAWRSLRLFAGSKTGNRFSVIFEALRTEEHIVQIFSSYGLASTKVTQYWLEFDGDENVIEHYEYKYSEDELADITAKLLDSADSTPTERQNARIAKSFLAFKGEIFSDQPDPWALAAHATGLTPAAPTIRQRAVIESKSAKSKGKKGGSRPKKNKALQEVILSIVRDMIGAGEKTSIKAVWEHLASHESFCPHETGSEGCDHLYVDGDTLFWTNYSQDGMTESKKKRSLEPYVREAKQEISKAPQ